MSRLNTIDEIITDHNNIKDLFKRYKNETDRDKKAMIVNTMIREIAIHSEAEEATVYKSLEKESEADANHFRDEHQQLEETLYSLDYTNMDRQPDFDKKLEHGIIMFLKHSAEEESEPGQLAKLSKTLSPEDNDALAKEFLQYRDLVPTRPHPSAPQSGSVVHKALGAVTRGHDRIIEMMTGRDFVDLKYQHPAKGQVESLKMDDSLLGTTTRQTPA
ncbi:hypothetical protein OIV83_003537 [Microbotryomycetes sp. JL201]|nr:hypothetical protein OIV83_003537 [Microbotryomycetes sp. JL201]